ncbi:hypothetical protein GMLC_30280 [Geomonas limicola]|uniref:NlpC/P60 domain-containing protein n=1 Tax=Geomonas limicola TaxID=2740186 RepID=A0A6V8NEA1_9BACT|nr:NlpC/P60 family protein [Geomonas limicola]GFO69449.1 hypothetical protein GMLC_30280 [Geomonas limicola]
MKKFLLLLILSLLPASLFAADLPSRLVAQVPTPVLNTPAFAASFSHGRLDPCLGERPIEFVALPGTLFTVQGASEDHGVTIYRVTTRDYPYPSKTGYFVDSRFVRAAEISTPERVAQLPGLTEIQQGLLASLGKTYVWGGNVREGVDLLGKLYPEGDRLAGVDCSGLLYQATDGFTPRNTSALIGYGAALSVAGLSAREIARKLEPLDLIVWKGHVMIVLDNDSIIQSTMGCPGVGGVSISPIGEALEKLMKNRKPRDSYPQGSAGSKTFVVRRWFRR